MKTLMEIKKKKCALLEDEASDWLQIWMTSSSLDIKGKKAIKKKLVFLAHMSFDAIEIPIGKHIVLLLMHIHAHVFIAKLLSLPATISSSLYIHSLRNSQQEDYESEEQRGQSYTEGNEGERVRY